MFKFNHKCFDLQQDPLSQENLSAMQSGWFSCGSEGDPVREAIFSELLLWAGAREGTLAQAAHLLLTTDLGSW